jgi:hypothetical protein
MQGEGEYASILPHLRWKALLWLCDEATESEALRQQVTYADVC